MTFNQFSSFIFIATISSCCVDTSLASSFPVCSSSQFDPDGDGYGWENNMTCTVDSIVLDDGVDAGSTSTVPTCSSASSDEDNDGWGWENNQSCRVGNTDFDGSDSSPTPAPTTGSIFPSCSSPSFDEDGDGFGWENSQTCVVGSSVDDPIDNDPTDSNPLFPTCSSSSFDEDGDGFGWENSSTCIVDIDGPGDDNDDPDVPTDLTTTYCSSPAFDQDGDGFGWENNQSCTVLYQEVPSNFTADDVTDVVLTAGQSNALAPGTVPDDTLESPHERIFAWTKHRGWRVANLKTQVWVSYNDPRNNGVGQLIPAFRIAKSLVARDPNKVVGIIVTGESGMPIDFWDENGSHYPEILDTVNSALVELPNKNNVDLIWWMQGEADDPKAYDYGAKLQSLIARFRSQYWFNSSGYFVANETYRFDVNPIIRGLNTDGDPFTCFSEGEGLGAADGTHFDEATIRDIGDLVADKYINGCYNAS